MPSWVTDARHLPPDDDRGAPAAARRRAAFTRALVEAATSRLGDPRWRCAVSCIARVGRRRCAAFIDVLYDGVDTVEWACSACGEQGTISGFIGDEHDLSVYVNLGSEKLWGLGSRELAFLIEATRHLPELRSVLVRAEPRAEIPGLLIVKATLEELDDLYSLVEHLEDITRSPARLEVLEGLRAGLSTAMDGF